MNRIAAAVALAFVLAPIFASAQNASDLPKIHIETRLVEIGRRACLPRAGNLVCLQ